MALVNPPRPITPGGPPQGRRRRQVGRRVGLQDYRAHLARTYQRQKGTQRFGCAVSIAIAVLVFGSLAGLL